MKVYIKPDINVTFFKADSEVLSISSGNVNGFTFKSNPQNKITVGQL